MAVVGDSFVAAKHVSVSDKLHVRLEEMARERLPALRVAASAFGHPGTGQVNQLGYYDPFVSRISPHVVVLVFVQNDFADNFHVLQGMSRGADPDRLPFATARRNADSTFSLRRPVWGTKDLEANPRQGTAPEHQPTSPWLAAVKSWLAAASSWTVSTSRFARLLDTRVRRLARTTTAHENRTKIVQDTRYRHWFADWNGLSRRFPVPGSGFRGPDLPKAAQEALDRTGFALDQWMSIARRDNFSLAILASHTMRGRAMFDHLEGLTSPRDIPVIDQSAYIRRQGARPVDARFDHDVHWNAAGHQWAAEAVLEWLEQNPDACASRTSDQDHARAGPEAE